MARSRQRLLVASVALACACTRSPAEKPWTIERVALADETLSGNRSLAITPDELRAALFSAFQGSGRFVRMPSGDKPKAARSPMSCRLEVTYTRESMDGGGPQATAEVAVALELRRFADGGRFEAAGVGKAPFPASSPDQRAPAFRRALDQALAQAVEGEVLQLLALEKTDAALVADLGSKDARVRDFAVRALAERKNAAAVPALMERLKDPNREIALRAVGALRSVGDPRAVRALIDATQSRDTDFLLTVVDAVAALGGKDAEAFLFTVASGHPEEGVREAAQQAQERLKELPDAATEKEALGVRQRP